MTDLTPSTATPAAVPVSSPFNEELARIKTVGEQFDIEMMAVDAKKVAMAFCVEESKLTPLFFKREDVYKDGLHKVKGFNPDEDIIVVGFDEEKKEPILQLSPKASPMARFLAQLMPLKKAKDPKQLSTVAARVISMDELRKKGVPLVILAQNKDRARVDVKTQNVEFPKGSIGQQYESNNTVIILGNLYKAFKKNAAAASYMFVLHDEENNKDKVIIASVDATQVCAPNASNKFNVAVNNDLAVDQINGINRLLKKYGEPTLDQRIDKNGPRRPAVPGSVDSNVIENLPMPWQQRGPGYRP